LKHVKTNKSIIQLKLVKKEQITIHRLTKSVRMRLPWREENSPYVRRNCLTKIVDAETPFPAFGLSSQIQYCPQMYNYIEV